ncbi:transcriptional corepressor of histone-like protein genes [Plenodomus tracheiphilus IPT5]|uniref:Histone transcription regulator 3 homolog n=1 Tax=Plenodomus tracheiphilus IPT5 TaxID=1408161 RepID=A0A6A7BBU7_9PLEO|nr:transcriptional corepressor of histone-like protein genes [Plenodomus tracheiphilus IPT5]
MSKAAVSKASIWHPLNVEVAEQTAEDEADDTQEIQIEEALKLYAAALKSHSEGPQSFEQTAAAYKALFESDIFKYTESLSEYQRHQVFGEELVFDSILEDDFEAGPVQSAGAADSAPNTLPQILHLSYKNHGQFLLESMQYYVTEQGNIPQVDAWNNALSALNFFAEALDKEDTDLDLWMRAASVSAMLGSKRLTRYCLEAVLDGNDEQWESVLQLPGLEMGFAGQQLRDLVEKLEDSVSLMQPPLSAMKRKKLSETLKKRLNPFPFAPLPAEVAHDTRPAITKAAPESVSLTPSKWDWASVGEIILQQFIAEQRGMTDKVAPGSNITFNIPSDSGTPEQNEPEPVAEAVDATLPSPKSFAPARPAETSQPDAIMLSVAVGEMQVAAADDETMIEEPSGGAEVNNEDVGATASLKEPPLPPSRKRSTDSAGLPETAEGGRSRSKRIRGRDTVTEPAAGSNGRAAQDAAKLLQEQLESYTHADSCLHEIVKDIYLRLGVEDLKEPSELRNILSALPEVTTTDPIDRAACDMFLALKSGKAKGAQILLSSESFDLLGVTRDAGLNAFLGFAKSGSGPPCSKPMLCDQKLGTFTRNVNQSWLSTKEVAFAWMEALLSPKFFTSQEQAQSDNDASYIRFRWAEDVKRNLVQIIVNVDEFIHERMLERIEAINRRMLEAHHRSQDYRISDHDASQIEIVETLFELHLDVYSLIKHPHSQVDVNTQILQSDRLERWSLLARDAMQLRSASDFSPSMDDLALRHIWASVFHISVNDEVPPEHTISAMGELKGIFQSLGDHIVQLQNNAVMPELSVAAIDRELVRISMKDFFLKVFDQDEEDPVAVIESLEPILEEQTMVQPASDESAASGEDNTDARSSSTVSVGEELSGEIQFHRPSPVFEMRKFLDSANVNVRLSLWHRLRVAYEAIEYPPKVVACYLRSIETLTNDCASSNFQELSLQDRQVKLLTRFRVIDDMVVKILRIFRDEKSAFDCLAYEHVQTSMTAINGLLRILSAADMFRDLVRINHTPMPRIEGLPSQTFVTMSARIDDIHLRLWILQYHLLREAISQDQEDFPTPSDDLFEFLRHVHHATGVRHFCHQSNRQFLRQAKDELLRLDDVIDGNSYATELCQVLFDLYGLKLFVNPLECQEFSATPDAIDKKTAFSILPFVMSQVAKVDIKDLPKTELKGTVEKVHAALGRPKQHEDISFNRKIISTFFKSPLNPVSLFSCLKGIGSLPTKQIRADEAVAASKGWYYMMGNIALSKFRSQKRMTQGPTEDLNYAQAFFVQDLEYSMERWETWYRLAQANDTQLEEAVSWNADKLNSNSVELVNFQRAAINCYIMAVACAVRDADAAPQTMDKVAQMYTEFGNRIYASSREPFGMEAFQVREAEKRFCNNTESHNTYRDITFVPLQPYTAWKFASTLYKRAIKGQPKKWWNHYMLGKCAWKMWLATNNAMHYAQSVGAPPPPDQGQPSWDEVVDAFIGAIEALPSKKGRSGEPILEPHYKLVSIVHKLFLRRAISYEKGVELLAHSSYSRNVTAPTGMEDWERYILAVLKVLRTVDKSSWHHRIISRSAHIIYEEGKDIQLAGQAKHELTQQMFTKTMTVQVWKPENERPGRHFVYTTRYTRYFLELLDLTTDKTNFEALAKRVRRKQTDFFEHQKLWQEMCSRYLKLLRRIGQVPDGQEDSAFKSVNHDEFNVLALRLEAWCQNPATQHPVLDVLRDAIELKRLNNGLMKSPPIDDLIGDTYAMLYTLISPTLPPLPTEQQQQPVQPPQPGPSLTAPTQSSGAMPISSLMQVQVDGPHDPLTVPVPPYLYQPTPLQSQPPPQVATPAELPPKSRAKAVGRREVARRAEACVQKATATPAPLPTSMPIRSPPVLHATPASLNARPTSPEKTETVHVAPISNDNLQVSFDNEIGDNNSGSATAAASVNNDEVQPSAPASVHDDADDESELSELDEDEVQEIEQQVGGQGFSRRDASGTAIAFGSAIANKARDEDATSSAVKEEDVEDDEEQEDDDDDGDDDVIDVQPRGKRDEAETMDVDSPKE